MSGGGDTPPGAGAKAELRRRVLAARRALDPDMRATASRACLERLMREPRVTAARCLCAYAPLPFELDVSALYEHVWSMGKKLALPRIDQATGELHLHRHGPDDALEVTRFSLREPLPDAVLIADDEVDVVLVPGVAFDERGYRLGYGQGYYDRLLPRLPGALRVGVGFELQLVPTLPHDHWDVPVHRFVSEARSLALEAPEPLLP